MKKLFSLLFLLPVVAAVHAQMTLTFDALEGVTTKQFSNGITLVEFPIGTDLTTVMQKASFKVDGIAVDATSVLPSPATLSLTDDQQVNFLYQGKVYPFRFSEGKYFTAVFTSDPHIAHSRYAETSVSVMQGYVDQIVTMGKAGGKVFAFDALPGYVPTCDIAFSTGDMDGDSKTDDDDFKTAHAGFASAGIPFVTMCGNHDLVPDYWTGENPDKGLKNYLSGGYSANNAALSTIASYRNNLSSFGITDVQTITDGTGHTQFDPFSFSFNGVRFYVGQTYWFQKPYKREAISSATYYAPDGILTALDNFVSSHTSEPSVWMQHYPFLAGSDCDRWWLDQNDVGKYIKTSDTSIYGTSDDVPVYTDDAAIAVAKKKKDALLNIIKKTKNAVHFSGHVHSFSKFTYNGLVDYTTAAVTTGSDSNGSAYLVLMKGNKGVIEVKRIFFSDSRLTVNDDKEPVYAADKQSVAVRLQQSISSLGIDVSEATAKLNAATMETDIDEAVSGMTTAFDTYLAGKGNKVDITAMLGANTDMETAQGALYDGNYSALYNQPGWNVCITSNSTAGNRGFIKLMHPTGGDVPATGAENSLFLRAKWQSVESKVQVMKQTALPAGTYQLCYDGKQPGTLAQNLCYFEVDGKRTTLTLPSSWQSTGVFFDIDHPALLTLSFGFVGGEGGTESAITVDNIKLYRYIISNGDDLSGLITNVSFDQGTKSYTVQGSGGAISVPVGWDFAYSFDGWNDCKTESGYFNAWAGTINRAELSQQLSLPNGAYRFTADVAADLAAADSRIALYGAAGANIGRSEEVNGTGPNTFASYSCAFDVTDYSVTIGIRSDKGFYKIKNLHLTYLGPSAAEETATSYLLQDYYWSGRYAQWFDASNARYAQARNAIIYPLKKNQLINAASATQFASTDNKIVDGTCASLVVTDGEPFSSPIAFDVERARFTRSFTAGMLSTLCLPFALDPSLGTFYSLSSDNGSSLIFTEVSTPQCNTPYIFHPVADGVIITTDTHVEATPTEMATTATESGYYLRGVYTNTGVSNIYGLSVTGELLKASTATMNPFRAFIQSPIDISEAKAMTAIFDGETTAISSLKHTIDKVDVYSIGGRLLRQKVEAKDALQGLPHGVYVISGENGTSKHIK